MNNHADHTEDSAYKGVYVQNKKYYPMEQNSELSNQIPPGSYRIRSNSKQFWFEKIDLKFDSILNLPSKEFRYVTEQFSTFLQPEIKSKFSQYGFLYKRSALLYGKPGVGKTIITNRIAEEVITKYNGICLLLEQAGEIAIAFDVLNSLQPNTPVVVVLEELDVLLQRDEREMLVLLDGAIQKENVMFLATTNHIDKIPKRILRPGRFGLVVEMHYPTEEARRMFFETKLGVGHESINTFVSMSDGLSIDELKEIIMSCVIFQNDIHSVVERIKNTRSEGCEYTLEEDEEDDWK